MTPRRSRASHSCATASVVATPARPFLHSLDALPMAWDLVDWGIYCFYPMPETNLAIVSSSRGCDQACSFCSQQVVLAAHAGARASAGGLRRRARDAARTVRRRRDDALRRDARRSTAPAGSASSTCSSSATSGCTCSWRRASTTSCATRTSCRSTARAGIRHIYVGVERTDQATLDLFKKNTEVEMGKKAIELINCTRHDLRDELRARPARPTRPRRSRRPSSWPSTTTPTWRSSSRSRRGRTPTCTPTWSRTSCRGTTRTTTSSHPS